MTPVLRGGPLDGLRFEIKEGQEELGPFEVSMLWGEGPARDDELAAIEDTRYRFAGQVEGGLAVFVPGS